MNPTVTFAPESWPITLAQAKAQCRLELDFVEEDAWLTGAIRAAVSWSQTYCHRSWVTQTRSLTLDCWPCDPWIRLQYGPHQSITSVAYIDENGDSHTLSSAAYYLEPKAGFLVLKSGYSWPSTALRPKGGIEITYVAGMADDFADIAADNPRAEDAAAVQHALLLMIGAWYVNREDEVIGVNVIPTAVMNGARALLGPLVEV